MRGTLGLDTAATHPATDFQSADAELSAIAGLVSAEEPSALRAAEHEPDPTPDPMAHLFGPPRAALAAPYRPSEPTTMVAATATSTISKAITKAYAGTLTLVGTLTNSFIGPITATFTGRLYTSRADTPRSTALAGTRRTTHTLSCTRPNRRNVNPPTVRALRVT